MLGVERGKREGDDREGGRMFSIFQQIICHSEYENWLDRRKLREIHVGLPFAICNILLRNIKFESILLK